MTSEKRIDSIINHALSATLRFIKNNYEELLTPSVFDTREDDFKGLSESEKEYIDRITKVVNDLGNQHEEAVALAVERAEAYCLKEDMVICPDCKERTLVINDNNETQCHCYLCGYKANGIEAANDFIENIFELDVYRTIKNGGEIPLYNCPECGNKSLLRFENEYRCFSCRMRYAKEDINFCIRCGELYYKYDEEDVGVCEECKNHINEKIENE